MKSKLTLTAGLTAAMTLLPALSFASNKAAAPDAFGLLKTLRSELQQTSEHVASLQSSVRHADVDWRGQAPILDYLRADVNTMGATALKLERARATASPEEQKAIDEAIPILNEMAANTSAAIHFLNTNQSDFWKPEYQTRVYNLVHEYEQVSKVVGDSVHLTELRAKEKHIETEFGM